MCVYCVWIRLVDDVLPVFPVGCNALSSFVIPCQTMDSTFNENQTEFGILILPVAIEMFTNRDGFLDKHVKVFGKLWSQTFRLENTQNLASGDILDLSDSLGVTKMNANLRRNQTFFGEFADLIRHFIRRYFKP